ncbi:MAG: hypothetical protein WBK77_04210 [Alphaproteobacteria bacterium]
MRNTENLKGIFSVISVVVMSGLLQGCPSNHEDPDKDKKINACFGGQEQLLARIEAEKAKVPHHINGMTRNPEEIKEEEQERFDDMWGDCATDLENKGHPEYAY